MNSSEAQQARLTLGLRPEDVAVEVSATPDAVVAWETGRIRVPTHVATHLAWRLAVFERENALRSSGLAECDWLRAFENRPEPSGMNAHNRHVEELTTHLKTCETCRTRETYVSERFGPMPRAPLRGWLAIAVPIFDRINRLPAWARPAATGAVLFTGYSLFKVIFYIPTIARDPVRGSLAALGGITASASIGAVLGLLYGQYRRIREERLARRTVTE